MGPVVPIRGLEVPHDVRRLIRQAFIAVKDRRPVPPSFFARVVDWERFGDHGIHLAYWDSEGRPWVWIATYCENESRRIYFKRWEALIHRLLDLPGIEVHCSTHQSPNARRTWRILAREGFKRYDPEDPHHWSLIA